MKIKIYTLILLLGFLAACMEDEPFKLSYAGFEPREINDGWLLSTPEKENVDRLKLERVFNTFYNENRFRLFRSLIIVRNGRIIAEVYPHDPNDIYKIQNVKSVTKSITSILTGIALKQNYLTSLNERLSDIYPEYFEKYTDKKEITIRHALTMQTGIYFINDIHYDDFYNADDITDYILSLPLNEPPGKVFRYGDGNPNLVSFAIQKRYGKSLGDFANEFLISPLNITEWKWETSKNGVGFGGTNLYLKPRDMAKIGQMLLQNGRWNNQQIVDSAYIAEATKEQVKNYWYGYYFWTFPDTFHGIFEAAGHGGQEIIVAPNKKLVVVVTAWPYITDTEWLRDNFVGTIFMDILSACY